jgi:hypothetical protein
MAKQSGMGGNFYVAGRNLTGDVGSLSRVGGGPATIDVTSIDKFAMERLGGLRDGEISYTAYFNPTASETHAYLDTLPRTDVIETYTIGTTLGNPAAAMVGKQVNYDPTHGQDGSLTFGVQSVANAYGLEWGRQLTAGLRTDTTATNGASIDTTASVSFGWQAYLQVTAITGTSVTVSIEDSANDADWLPLANGAFVAATTLGAQRIASTTTTATVRRYLRAVTTGTFNPATFSVVFVKNTDRHPGF